MNICSYEIKQENYEKNFFFIKINVKIPIYTYEDTTSYKILKLT